MSLQVRVSPRHQMDVASGVTRGIPTATQISRLRSTAPPTATIGASSGCRETRHGLSPKSPRSAVRLSSDVCRGADGPHFDLCDVVGRIRCLGAQGMP
jgi:hypothetical protein